MKKRHILSALLLAFGLSSLLLAFPEQAHSSSARPLSPPSVPSSGFGYEAETPGPADLLNLPILLNSNAILVETELTTWNLRQRDTTPRQLRKLPVLFRLPRFLQHTLILRSNRIELIAAIATIHHGVSVLEHGPPVL